MDIKISISEITVPPPTGGTVIRTLRKWGDPILIELLGASTAIVGKSNFQVVKLASVNTNGIADFNDVANTQRVDYQYLRSLQYAQPSSPFGSIDQIMNWLVNHGGTATRPYWMKGTPTLYFGTIGFGGQKIEVDANIEYIPGDYPAVEKRETIPFRKIYGLRKSEMSAGYTYATHPHKIQRATEARQNPPDTYSDTPRGTEILHPVWDWRDWPPYPHGGALYIADAFLE